MSKESYARGFVKAAAAAGVDPVGLAKFAQEKQRADDDAGIGSVADNFGLKVLQNSMARKGTAKTQGNIA